ncbi:hypothetical protein [Mesorhizobium huakuii]|uniref:Uncharacterized protein n=1 Tax=Mesorhizobium huakuii TaxID=28104 RepID=A0A7G6T4F4_9HYPH|nr:hypothetical protein [Mesorhizobium huakuii]QND61636.1 hypothetical protein HB778_35770 [Mesorhizobium huakuii]
MSPAKPGFSETAGGVESRFGRGRLPSELTFLSLRETSTLSLSRHGQHLKLDSAKSNLMIMLGDGRSGSVNGVRCFCRWGQSMIYSSTLARTAKQLNQVRQRQLSDLGMDGLYIHLAPILRRAETRLRPFQKLLSPVRDQFA